ncbi:MAG: M13 family metallopeptidase [Bacteroidetes bacterium]|nr:M13 family metallopeptidase [Bacteroidota bacterium]
MSTFIPKALVVATSAVLLTGFLSFKNQPTTEKAIKNTGILLSDLDTTINPAVDFFAFVNGNWIKNNPVPPSESRWASFNEVRESNFAILKEVLISAAADTRAAQGSNRRKIGDFYASGMDSLKLEQQGYNPIMQDLKAISNLKESSQVLDFVAHLQSRFNFAMFNVFAEQDLKNSSRVIAYVNQGGTSLPDRDYYIKDDSRSSEIRAEFVKHIAKMLVLIGEDPTLAAQQADKILEMETRFAKVSMSRVEMRNPEKTYNLKSIEEMDKLAPAIKWKNHLAKLGIVNQMELVTNNPAFFTELNVMIGQYSIDNWKSYLKWRVVREAAPMLSSSFSREDFRFRQGVLTGTKQMKERWKLVQETIDNKMGEALGEVYCEKAFTPATKKRMMELVDNLGLAFKDRIQKLAWMSDATKEQAQLKLSTIMKKIGYPDKWRDYTALQISRDSYYTNAVRASEFEFNRMITKIGKPVDRTEWGISPPTVNAYYNPSMNEIVFPAGILQPPFFNPNADDAVNYGGIGAVIGHEMTHGFDDEGRQFDSEGNLKKLVDCS